MNNTNSFNIPKPATGDEVNSAIAQAWAAGEIKIKPVKKYMGRLAPEGEEWYLINWVMRKKNEVTIMYNGAYSLKIAFKNEHLADNAKLIGFLLYKLAGEMQSDGKGLYPAMKAVN